MTIRKLTWIFPGEDFFMMPPEEEPRELCEDGGAVSKVEDNAQEEGGVGAEKGAIGEAAIPLARA